jgi:hypothetical protein
MIFFPPISVRIRVIKAMLKVCEDEGHRLEDFYRAMERVKRSDPRIHPHDMFKKIFRILRNK